MTARRHLSASRSPAEGGGARGTTTLEALEALEPGPASRCIDALLELLEGADIAATRDASAFYPHPVGVLVGLPELARRTMGARIYLVRVLVVSGDALNGPEPVDRIYAVADAVAGALSIDGYRPSSFSGSANAEPLPALELIATLTVSEE